VTRRGWILLKLVQYRSTYESQNEDRVPAGVFTRSRLQASVQDVFGVDRNGASFLCMNRSVGSQTR
jgi:hypothetical protein